MRKINFLFAIAAICMAIGFTACGEEEGPDQDGNNNNQGGNNNNDTTVVAETEAMKLATGTDFGNQFNHYSNLVRLIFTSDSVNYNIKTGKITGTGKYYTIDVMAEADSKSHFPKAGTYSVAKDEDISYPAGTGIRLELLENGAVLQKFTYENTNYGCYEYTVENDKVVATKFAKTGQIKITGDATKCNVEFAFEFSDDKDNVTTAGGKYEGAAPKITNKAVDASKNFEQEDADPQTEFVFNKQYVTTIAGGNGTGMEQYEIFLEGDDNLFGIFAVYIASGENKYIKYTVTHKIYSGAASRSKGAYKEGDKLMVGSPYLGYRGASGGMSQIWFVDGGTLDVKENGITFDLVTYKGTKIKAKYEGKVTFDPKGMAPELAPKFVAE